MSSPTPLLPPPLRPGDGVSLVAPASPPKPEALLAAIEVLHQSGYQPKTYRDECVGQGYLAGSDDERIAELEAAFADPETRLVLAVRGGYGAGRIVDRINFGLLAANPKLVCGYSDITALHAAVHRHTGLPTLHGPNLIDGVGDNRDVSAAERSVWTSLVAGTFGDGANLLPAEHAESCQTISGGSATGRLIGGNLAVLLALAGTPEEPDFDGAILFLEDTGEAPYRIDRLFTQLRVAGKLGRLAGVVTGYFSDIGDAGGDEVDRLLDEFLAPLGIPVLARFPAGHEHPNLPLPLGARVELDASGRQLTLRQSIVGESSA